MIDCKNPVGGGWLAATLLTLAGAASAQGTVVLRVDADAPVGGTTNGLSWSTAFTDLQSGLGAASALFSLSSPPENVEIWLAEGTYYPTVTVPSTNRNATFTIFDAVQVYGGFIGHDPTMSGLGNEASKDVREGSAENTVLSGNLTGGLTNQTGNSFHVVEFSCSDPSGSAQRRALLDSVTVEFGYADGTVAPASTGGGIFGGNARYFALAHTKVRNCFALENGGGVGLVFPSDVQVRDCVFTGNSAGRREPSGALVGQGGGVHLDQPCDFSNVTFTNCSFYDNAAPIGGGFAADEMQVGRLSLVNCLVYENRALVKAGGIWLRVESQGIPEADRCFMEIAHSTVTRNTGGGIFLASPQNNNPSDPAVRIRSTISYGNSLPPGSIVSVERDLLGPEASAAEVRYSNVFRSTPAPVGGSPPVWPGPGNISVDPQFRSVANDNYRLKGSSPCIDAGEDTSILPLSPPPPMQINFGDPELGDIADLDEDDNTMELLLFDLDRNAREQDAPAVPDTGLAAALAGISDMGCFEFDPEATPQQ